MALTTNAELETAIQNWLDDTGVSGRAAEFVVMGEAMIHRRLRVRCEPSR